MKASFPPTLPALDRPRAVGLVTVVPRPVEAHERHERRERHRQPVDLVDQEDWAYEAGPRATEFGNQRDARELTCGEFEVVT
jgi:hypothetical protein